MYLTELARICTEQYLNGMLHAPMCDTENYYSISISFELENITIQLKDGDWLDGEQLDRLMNFCRYINNGAVEGKFTITTLSNERLQVCIDFNKEVLLMMIRQKYCNNSISLLV